MFGFSSEYIKSNQKELLSIVKYALPIMFEKFTFSSGKVITNSIGTHYGSEVVGALGVSNSMSALITSPPSSIGDTGAALIRQNLGNGNKERAFKIFKYILCVNLLLGIAGFVGVVIFMDSIIHLFASGDTVFASMIKRIFTLEMVASLFLTIHLSVMALLYAMGYMKISFMLNFIRLFIVRIPPLLFFTYYTSLDGSTAIGLVMMFSNGIVGVIAIIITVIVCKRGNLQTPKWILRCE